MKNNKEQSTNSVTATSIRVPDEFLLEIQELANKIGDSQNGTMLHLMHWGMKIYNSGITISPITD